MELSIRIHAQDLKDGFGLASLPPSLIRKYGNAAKQTSWQYLFPSINRCVHPIDGYISRHHIHESAYSKALRAAVRQSGILKRVTAHTFRHSFEPFRNYLVTVICVLPKFTRTLLAIDGQAPLVPLIYPNKT
jgi:integrase